MTLACEDEYSKLVEVVAVVDVSDEDRVGNSLLQIWKPRFGPYQIIVADAADAVSVNFSGRCKFLQI